MNLIVLKLIRYLKYQANVILIEALVDQKVVSIETLIKTTGNFLEIKVIMFLERRKIHNKY